MAIVEQESEGAVKRNAALRQVKIQLSAQ